MAASTLPDTVRPFARWNAITALAVPAPNTPSAPPRNGDAGLDQGLLQGDDARAVLVVAGEPGRRRGRPGGRAPGWRRRRATVSPSRRAVASSTMPEAGMPLLRWARMHGALRRRAEDAVGAAAQRPAHLHQGLLEADDRRAARPDAEADDRRRRRRRCGRCRVAAEAELAAGRGVDHAGRAESLGLLERLDRRLGAAAEDAVSPARDGDAGLRATPAGVGAPCRRGRRGRGRHPPSARRRGRRGAADPERLSVAASAVPVTFRPLACWKALTAASVAMPKMPSAPPATVMPALISACCSCLTR